jgi:hypothetical protein
MPDVRGRLILAQACIDALAQQVVPGPGQAPHFGDKLGRTQGTRLQTGGEQRAGVLLESKNRIEFPAWSSEFKASSDI